MFKRRIIGLVFSVSILPLATPFLGGQTILSADGKTDTYGLITKVLGAGPEVPDCGHAAFGPHVTQAMDNQLGKYVFQFHAHVTADNDRCVNFDRQRTEIKTASSSPAALKAFNGDTMNFRWRFKLDAGFRPSHRFTHIHQIKAGDGNAGAPLITLSPEGDSMKVGYFSDNNKSETLTNTGLRPFLGTWVEANETITFAKHGSITLTITRVADGKVLLNYHNSDIDFQRSRTNFYRPKWGIYRSIKDASALRDETVLFSEFCIAKAPRVCSEFAASRLPAMQTEAAIKNAGFSIMGQPAALTVAAGGTRTFNVLVAAENGFNGDVTLRADGLPPGVIATFSPTVVKQGTGRATLTLVSDSSTTIDKHTISITGTSGDVSHTSTVTFIVIPVASAASPSAEQSTQIPSAKIPSQRTSNGHPILPPKWAFGVLFGSYYDQEQLLDAMTKLRNGYCGDLLWVDSSWLSSNYDHDAPHYIDFMFDSRQFHDPNRMIATIHKNHFRFGVWEWPYIDKSNHLYRDGESNGYFIKGPDGNVVNGGGWHGVTFTGQLDFTNPEARTWWNSLNVPLLRGGFDFFKIDTYSTVAKGGVLADGNTSADNLRRHYHQTVFELTQAASGGRGFILTHRQPATGNDQFPGMWTGDTSASWKGFLEQDMGRAAKMNTSSTAAYWGGDTGGYNGDPSDELYIRWLQYGTFTPITEFFGNKKSKTRFPWKFDSQAQEVFKTYTSLRYRLLPFRYSNAQIAYHETPVKYPVRFVPDHGDEIIVGNGPSEILVAPVTTEGARARQVFLPAGANWIQYWTGQVYQGGTTSEVPAPLQQVPMFVKAGSIIPMGPEMEYVDQKPADPLTLDIYPSGPSSYTLYEDDGVSTAYMGGAVSRTMFSLNNTGGKLSISIGESVGAYEGKLSARTYVLKINKQLAPDTIVRDGAAMTQRSAQKDFDSASDGWYYDQASGIVWAKFRIPTNRSTTVNVTSKPQK